MDFATLADTSMNSSIGKTVGELVLRTAVAIGLFFPLIALALVLIVRVWFLWIVIVASPFLIVREVFQKELVEAWKAWWDNFSIKNIISVIFAPVVTVFAISISLVFMNLLISSFKWWSNQVNLQRELGIESQKTANGWTTYSIENVAQIETKNSRDRWIVSDPISRMIVCAFWIGIMRSVVFMAIKANSIGKSIWSWVQKFWEWMMKTMPMVPVPGWGANLTLGSIWNSLGNWWITTRIINERNQKWEENMENFLESKAPKFFNKDTSFEKWETEKVFNTIKSGKAEDVNALLNQQGMKAATPEDRWALLSNDKALIDMIQKMEKPEEREKANQVLNQVTGRTDFLGDIEKEQIKTKFGDELKSIKKGKDEKETIENIKAHFNNSPTAKQFFEKTKPEKDEYTHEVDWKAFIIKKESDDKYTVTEKK